MTGVPGSDDSLSHYRVPGPYRSSARRRACRRCSRCSRPRGARSRRTSAVVAPRHTAARTIFVSARAPYGSLSSPSAVRHVLVKHAHAAGVRAAFLGSHALRHSHACRQVELEVRRKVLSDILGHRRPASTSVYIRIALARLRPLALPVPR